MSLCVTGTNTTIIRALRELTPPNEKHVVWQPTELESMHCSRYVFAHGMLESKCAAEMMMGEMIEHATGNWLMSVEFCEKILEVNPLARICLISSESGFKGSFNEVYAGSKAALNLYVETRKVGPHQQLVAVAPTIVEDSGMTRRRPDYQECMERGTKQRRGRWLRAKEVAAMIHFLLYVDDGSVCNTVVRMTGGLA